MRRIEVVEKTYDSFLFSVSDYFFFLITIYKCHSIMTSIT